MENKDDADALSQEPGEVAAQPTETTPPPGGKPPKEPSALKKVFKKINLYLLLFGLVVVIGGAVAAVSYLNSKKAPVTPAVETQELTTDSLKQLANSEATVGSSGQTLTVQGNAIFSGQVLIRSDLNVAGTIKVGKEMLVTDLTAAGKTNLSDTQVNSLQVASNSVFQGSVTFQKDINVGGAASFNAPVTMSQLTVTKLIISGNGTLAVPNHISFPGASPTRTIDNTVLGSGGTASISGSDTAGSVNINTGSGTAAGCFVNVKFAQPFASTPRVLISPVGAGAGITEYYVIRTTTNFSICTATPPPTGQTFGFDYFVTG